MRIGLVAADFHPNVGGVAAHVVELGSALAAAGHTVHVVSRRLGTETAGRSEYRGMQVHRPALPQLRPFSHWALSHWLKRFAQREQIDLLHVHGMRPLPATRTIGLPVVFTNHTSGFLQRMERSSAARRRAATLLRHVNLVLAPSEELVESTLALGLDIPARYIPNGVDPDRFTPGDSMVRQRLGIAADETVVLLARRLVAKNGVCVFAEAAPKFVRPGTRLLFAGDGPERSQVEAILKNNGCLASAIFLGNVQNGDMPDIYRAADISVLPSFMEATSITGLESMATGLPLVGTNVGGIPAIIDHGRTGVIVPPGKPDQLGQAIATLCSDPKQRRTLGIAARARVHREFAWSVLASQTAECYDRTLWMCGRTASQAKSQRLIPASASEFTGENAHGQRRAA